jgi:hypothetical protein
MSLAEFYSDVDSLDKFMVLFVLSLFYLLRKVQSNQYVKSEFVTIIIYGLFN